MITTSGNRGDTVRSDCHIALTIHKTGGIKINIKSKVKSLFGKSINDLCSIILAHFDIENAFLEIDDQGALPFVIAARLEHAIKQQVNTSKEFLLPFYNDNYSFSTTDKIRRSRLYLPGNNPKLMINAGIYGADGIILDLEDSVAPEKKQEARYLVRNALRGLDFGSAERMVRINQLPMGLEDLKFIIPHQVQLVLIPKCENSDQIIQVDEEIKEISQCNNHQILLMPIVESSLGVINAFEIAKASKNVVAIAIGLEDYTADLGVQRTEAGTESFFARSAVVNAAKAAGIQAIDSVFSDVANINALTDTVQKSKAMGFEGMGCIHPRQVKIIHQYFAPDISEIEKAQKIVLAFEKAERQNLSVVSLGSKMIDPPVVKRALKTISQAESLLLIEKEWRKNHE
ncbi:MAG: HpcH/HpaI aldolase/citrate lyase family protein [Bacteroidales bacterium]|nr:HpcH/HpaI aldolase/citrate lyase family protein [Bacteroidales bacterium]MBN2819726.1 HpcH/HpaI aldolase/citrate lyase family protein [Bacteroidales bacterium]